MASIYFSLGRTVRHRRTIVGEGREVKVAVTKCGMPCMKTEERRLDVAGAAMA
jgi:hypothetical protein